jgi:seryl-tRNA synthetase
VRKLFALGKFALLALSACSEQGLANYCSSINSSASPGTICYGWGQSKIAEKQQAFKDKISAVHYACEAKRKKKIYKTDSAMLSKCAKPQIMQIYLEARAPNLDIIDALFSRGIVLQEKVEKRQITEAQAEEQLAQYNLELNNIENQRQAVRNQEQESLILGLMAIQASQTPASSTIHCSTRANPLGAIGGSIDTDCY